MKSENSCRKEKYGTGTRKTSMHMHLFFALLVSSLLLAGASISNAAGLEDRIEKIQNAYDTIKDVRGHFVQKNSIKELKRTDTYKGSFYIKPPRIKWEYTGEKAQTVYISNESIIVHQKKANQVIKSRFDKTTYGQTPFAFLTGLGNIKEEFDVTAGSGGTIILKPKKGMGNITKIEIKPSDGAFPIRAITFIDKLSNVNTITLSDVRTNTGLKDSVFRFTPPKGAAVMEN
jgi:outer membrane lipoprotein carrier protein